MHEDLVEEEEGKGLRQVFESVQLLEMRGTPDGYYKCVEEWAFVAGGEEGEGGSVG